jgi:hypothetical protein
MLRDIQIILLYPDFSMISKKYIFNGFYEIGLNTNGMERAEINLFFFKTGHWMYALKQYSSLLPLSSEAVVFSGSRQWESVPSHAQPFRFDARRSPRPSAGALERFPAKWMPVRVNKTRKNK